MALVLKVSFVDNKNTYSIEATDYGCDIFYNGKYSDTIQNDNKKSQEFWIGKGIESIIQFRDRCLENQGK